jgi:hypothetical protein
MTSCKVLQMKPTRVELLKRHYFNGRLLVLPDNTAVNNIF